MVLWLYTTLTVSEVATVLLLHINSLLLKVTAYWPVEIQLTALLGIFPKEVMLTSYNHCQPEVPVHYYY